MARRPIAHRAFTVLLAALVIGSVIGPAVAAEPAAAQSFEDRVENCSTEILSNGFLWVYDQACSAAQGTFGGDVDPGLAATDKKIALYEKAMSLKDRWDSYSTVQGNYLEDTETIASLEAKHAIGQAYENGTGESLATAKGQSAIEDYYATKQINLLEELSSQQAQAAYMGNVTQNDSEILKTWNYPGVSKVTHAQVTYEGNNHLTGNLTNKTVTLVNGSSYTYQVAEASNRVKYANGDKPTKDVQWSLDITQSVDSNGYKVYSGSIYSPSADTTADFDVYASGQYRVSSVEGSDAYTDTEYFEFRNIRQRWTEIENQSTTVVDNYDGNFTEQVYTELDNGNINVSDLYGAEGMARYLSGDSNVTDDRFQLATYSLLGMDRPDNLGTSMVIEYDAATGREMVYNDSNSTYEEQLSWSSGTVEGLLFSEEVPADGFQVNETYNASELNGTQLVSSAKTDETVKFYEGNFTIREMYDSNGDAVDSTTWETRQYDTYDSSEYIALLEQVKEDRAEIEAALAENSNSGSDVALGDLLDGLSGGNGMIGMFVVGIVVTLFVVGKLSN